MNIGVAWAVDNRNIQPHPLWRIEMMQLLVIIYCGLTDLSWRPQGYHARFGVTEYKLIKSSSNFEV